MNCKFCPSLLSELNNGNGVMVYLCPLCNMEFGFHNDQLSTQVYYLPDHSYSFSSYLLITTQNNSSYFIHGDLITEISDLSLDTPPDQAKDLGNRLIKLKAYL